MVVSPREMDVCVTFILSSEVTAQIGCREDSPSNSHSPSARAYLR